MKPAEVYGHLTRELCPLETSVPLGPNSLITLALSGTNTGNDIMKKLHTGPVWDQDRTPENH